jgi:hypothetical protein
MLNRVSHTGQWEMNVKTRNNGRQCRGKNILKAFLSIKKQEPTDTKDMPCLASVALTDI